VRFHAELVAEMTTFLGPELLARFP
jgi:hypothetical protein